MFEQGIVFFKAPDPSVIKSSDIFFKCNGYFKENYNFPKFQRGSNIFQGGSNCLFPIEPHITCDFPGGGGGSAVAQW